jgi:hypothetical protein
MIEFLIKLLLGARTKLKSRARLEAENIVLRQQVIVLSRKARSRVRLRNIDRLIFGWLYRSLPWILNAITVVKPETVIGWHRRDGTGNFFEVQGIQSAEPGNPLGTSRLDSDAPDLQFIARGIRQ